jgi:hypothetical protein
MRRLFFAAIKVFFAQANAGAGNPTDVFGATATP